MFAMYILLLCLVHVKLMIDNDEKNIQQIVILFSVTGGIRKLSSPRAVQSATCAVHELTCPRVGISTSCPVIGILPLLVSWRT